MYETNFRSFIYYMQSFPTNKRSIIKISNKLQFAVSRFSISDPYLNIQLALPNPPSLGLSTAITSSIFSVSVSYPQEGQRKNEREKKRKEGVFSESTPNTTMMTGWLFHPLQLRLTDVSINPS